MRDISKIAHYVKEKMKDESTGHDWFHIQRVLKTATLIAKREKKADIFIIQAAALLHDIGDWKIKLSNKTEEEILDEAFKKTNIQQQDAIRIKNIILNMSFRKNVVVKKKLTLEGKIVQDADRLEALGAIGIARAFAYGGKKNRPLYNPDSKPRIYKSTEEYINSDSHTINHFYEKLFKLRKYINTKTAKAIALKREKFMKAFLKEFYREWDGKA